MVLPNLPIFCIPHNASQVLPQPSVTQNGTSLPTPLNMAFLTAPGKTWKHRHSLFTNISIASVCQGGISPSSSTHCLKQNILEFVHTWRGWKRPSKGVTNTEHKLGVLGSNFCTQVGFPRRKFLKAFQHPSKRQSKGQSWLGVPLHSHTGLSLTQAKPAAADIAAEGTHPSLGHFSQAATCLLPILLCEQPHRKTDCDCPRLITILVQWH